MRRLSTNPPRPRCFFFWPGTPNAPCDAVACDRPVILWIPPRAEPAPCEAWAKTCGRSQHATKED